MATKLTTGNKCQQGGIYKCEKCNSEKSIGINNICPPCEKCNGAATFTLVRPSK